MSIVADLPSKVRAILAELAIAERLRKDATIKQLEEIPLSRTTLSLEVPEEPALCASFEGVQLDLDVPAYTVLPIFSPRVNSARLAGAGADVGCAGETTFHARARCEAVEVFGAVSDSTRPFADDYPFVRRSVGVDLLNNDQCWKNICGIVYLQHCKPSSGAGPHP